MEFLLLGAFEVRAGDELVDLGPRRNRLILAILALEVGRPIPLVRLLALLWPGEPPVTAINAVMVAVSRLRTALRAAGPGVELARAGDGYALRTDPERIDAYRFLKLVERARATEDDTGRIALLDRALALWRGPALDGAPAEVRERLCHDLEEARLAAVEERLDAKLRRGAHRELIGELMTLVDDHPLREHLVSCLMLALYRSGRPAEALGVYRTARARLAAELGQPPGPELRELESAVLRDDPAIAAPAAPPPPASFPVPGQLPPVVGGFAGRLAELSMMDAAGPLIVLSGTAGAGKTTLAVKWAHRVRDRFPDGQLYVNLRGFDPSRPPVTPHEALQGFLDALEVPRDRVPLEPAARSELFRDRVAGRRLLVVLDNARDPEQIAPLLPGTPGCVTLVTSRTRFPGAVGVGLLDPDEARELLIQRLGADRVAAEPDAAGQLVARCARLALALAVVAARAMNWPYRPLAEFAEELREACDRLDILDSDDPETNVRAVLSWSYRSLSPGAARMFRLLAVHPGPDVATPAAASLAALAPGETQELLAELVRGNLLTEAVPGRYALHDLLRAYAEELATADDPAADRRAALQRALDHYLHTAVTAVRRRSPYRIGIKPDPPADGVRPDDPQDVFAWFRAEDEVLREALRQSAAQGFDRHTWQLAWALADEYGLAGRWQEWADSQETGLAAARRLGDRRGQANAHRSLGRALAWLRRYDDGHAHLTRAFTLFGELGVPADQANTQLGISWLLDQQGRHREALDHDERARDLYAAAGHRSGEAIALTAIAWDLGQLGEHERSLSYTRQALDVHEELGNLHGQESSWSNFGNAYLRLNRHAEAISAYENAVACARRKGDRTAEAYDLRMLGDAQEAAGRMAGARKSWTAALEILDDIEHPDAAEVRGRLTTLGAG